MGLLNLTLTTMNDDVFPLQVESSEAVDKLFEMVQMISGIPPNKQKLVLGQAPLPKTGTVEAAGVKDGDLLQVLPNANPFEQAPDGSAVDPEAFIAAMQQNPETLQRVSAQNKPLGDAIRAASTTQLQTILRQIAQAQARSRQAEQGPPMPEGDPLDPEYQQKMYEWIQQKNVEENFAHAMEHSPEVFGTVDMLYVNMTVNGEPVKAFIDSGAQSTIMTQTCAEKCRIMRLVDKRFAGVAVGVGSAKIIGRIHTCSLKVGSEFITTSVTVLDQRDGPQFIFGLDNLKRHQCCIDLGANQLKVGTCNVNLPFLPSHEVPQDFNSRRVNETEVDELDESGTIKDSVEGDLSAMRSGSIPANPPDAPGPSPTPAATVPAPAAAAVDESVIAQIQGITSASREQCIEALKASGGNADAATAMLLGL